MIIFDRPLRNVRSADLMRYCRKAQKLAGVRGKVSVLVTDNRRMRALNRRFRRKDKATDVLSFPRPQGGDIAISATIARENAARFGHALADELKILILHGMLHLSGHDHETDSGQMAALESRLRSRLKLPGSLINRAAARKAARKNVRTGRRT
jgi:probable rRNA maturation factor